MRRVAASSTRRRWPVRRQRDRSPPNCARQRPASRCRASHRASSRSSGWASTTSSRWRPRKKGSGPAFNGTSCAACHNVPAIGGAGTIAEMRAGTPRRERTVPDVRRHRRDALPPLLDSHPRLPGHRAGRGQRVRAARADSALRRRPGGGDSRRHDRRARGSVRSRPRWRVRARGPHRGRRHRRAPHRPVRLEERSTRRC